MDLTLLYCLNFSRLADKFGWLPKPAEPWTFSEPRSADKNFFSRLAGLTRHFENPTISLDFVTVKGGGHFVPTDRAPVSLQMIYNFIGQNEAVNYSTPLPFSLFERKGNSASTGGPKRKLWDFVVGNEIRAICKAQLVKYFFKFNYQLSAVTIRLGRYSILHFLTSLTF